LKVFSNIIGVCQVKKINGEMKECEKKEKKRKKVRRDQQNKGCGSQIFKSRSRSIVKRSWIEIREDYRRL
jgi:hypothetical protein